MNQVVSLRDALEVVPIFTGDNISLDQFIEGSKEVKDMLLAGTESNLTKLIKTKVKEEARKCVTGGHYRSVEDIIDSLKRVYSLNKSVYQLQGELGNIYQWDSEKVISYATRVRELGDRILDAHEANNNDRINENSQAALDSDIRYCFLRGLRTEIESRLQGVHNFKDTVNSALEMERKISATAVLHVLSSHQNFHNRNNQQQPFNRETQACEWTPRREDIGQWRPQSSAPNTRSW